MTAKTKNLAQSVNGWVDLAKSDLGFFPIQASNNACPAHIHFIASKIQHAIEEPAGDKNRLLIISVPPRHGKTELISKHLPAWYLGKYPKNRIILTSYGASLAEDNSSTAKDIFERTCHMWEGVFPSKSKWKKAAWNTNQGGGVIAAGVGGPCTGFGAELFIVDDYVKGHEEAESSLMREKIWSWWQSVSVTRLHPGAVVIILATRWHEDYLIGRLLKQSEEEKDEFPFDIETINLPALAESNDLMNRKSGSALWPGRYNETRLGYAKKAVGPYWWSALFQGSPTDRGGTLFKSSAFRYWEFDPRTAEYVCYRQDKEPIRIKRTELIRHVYVDPAIETKKVNDPTGMLAWGYSRKYKVWLLLDRINDRIEHTEIMETIKRLAWKNQCTLAGIENEKLGKVLVKQSAGNDRIAGQAIPFKEIPTNGLDKYARAVPMANYIENERVFFPKGAHWLSEYEGNLTKFPNAAHDEDVDCTSMAGFMESKLSVADVLAGK